MVVTRRGLAVIGVNRFRREPRLGINVTIHLADGGSVQGRVERVTRTYIYLVEHRIEVDGTLHEMKTQRVMVPVHLVRLVEERAQ